MIDFYVRLFQIQNQMGFGVDLKMDRFLTICFCCTRLEVASSLFSDQSAVDEGSNMILFDETVPF